MAILAQEKSSAVDVKGFDGSVQTDIPPLPPIDSLSFNKKSKVNLPIGKKI